jgi:cation:H+ antiporter
LAGTLLEFSISAAAIIIAGSFLTRFADTIAEVTRLGRLVIGSVLLAGATSLPELSVDVSAVRLHLADLAVGDLLGSSLMNLLILAVLDLSHHSRGRMLSRKSAAHALSGLLSAALMAVVALSLLTGKAFATYTVVGLGPGVMLVAVGYLLGVRLVYLDQQMAMQAAEEHGPHKTLEPKETRLSKATIGFLVCAGVIFMAGPHLAGAAGELAKSSGLGNTFVGTTLVAFATSLPELVSMLAALRLGAIDLAIGNVFGSNAFNMLLLVPLDIVQPGSLLATVSTKHVITCIAAVLATHIAVMGQLYQIESRTRLIEPDAWLVILIVVGALALIYYLP